MMRPRAVKPNWPSLLTISLKGCFCIVLVFLKIGIWYTSSLSGLSYSLVMNLHSITPFLVALFFYLLYKEALNRWHIIGIVLITICVVLIGVGSSTGSDTSSGTISPWVPIILAIIMSCVSSGSIVLIRYISIKTVIPM